LARVHFHSNFSVFWSTNKLTFNINYLNNYTLQFNFVYTKITRIKLSISGRKSCRYYFISSLELHKDTSLKYPNTIIYTRVFYNKVFADKLGITISTDDIKEVTGLARRCQSHIIKSGYIQTLYNKSNLGPDPQGRKRTLIYLDTAAIVSYLNDDSVPLNNRSIL